MWPFATAATGERCWLVALPPLWVSCSLPSVLTAAVTGHGATTGSQAGPSGHKHWSLRCCSRILPASTLHTFIFTQLSLSCHHCCRAAPSSRFVRPGWLVSAPRKGPPGPLDFVPGAARHLLSHLQPGPLRPAPCELPSCRPVRPWVASGPHPTAKTPTGRARLEMRPLGDLVPLLKRQSV